MSYPYILQGNNLTVVIDNVPHTVSGSHASFEKIKQALKDSDWEEVKRLVSLRNAIQRYASTKGNNVQVTATHVLYNGVPLHNYLTTRLVEMYNDGFPVDPLVNFLENLMQNPSARAVNELYSFLEAGNLPITPDGYLLAYKKVRADYKDCHSNTVLNKPAGLLTADEVKMLPYTTDRGVTVSVENGLTVVSMPRNQVDDDKDRTCSSGLHFCSEGYLKSFGGDRIVIVKINPRDVVSIPSDYNDTKGRACRYEVIGELASSTQPSAAFTKAVQESANGVPVSKATVRAGNSPFKAGYSIGYHRQGVPSWYTNAKDNADFDSGRCQGFDDYVNGKTARFVFTGTVPAVAGNAIGKNGKPLSMTKDAIRKREARARAAANKAAELLRPVIPVLQTVSTQPSSGKRQLSTTPSAIRKRAARAKAKAAKLQQSGNQNRSGLWPFPKK